MLYILYIIQYIKLNYIILYITKNYIICCIYSIIYIILYSIYQ